MIRENRHILPALRNWGKIVALFFYFCGGFAFAQESTREERILSTAITNLLHSHETLSGCGILLSSQTGEILARYGDIERHRDPGSTLKPFLYAEALQQGFITAQTRIPDEPYRINDSEVRNYDGKFHGPVTATTALAQSLNVPAVKLLIEGHLQEIIPSVLKDVGILDPMDKSPFPGFRIAMGGIPVTPATLANVYAGLYRNCFPRWTAGTSAMLLKMMRSIPMPHAKHLDVAWKTGTSQGNRDAWCLAITPEYTLCIWFGHDDFAKDPVLEGRTLAAPTAGAILTALYQENTPQWPAMPPDVAMGELCAKSGLTPTADCKTRVMGMTLKGIALRKCDICPEDGLYHTQIRIEE